MSNLLFSRSTQVFSMAVVMFGVAGCASVGPDYGGIAPPPLQPSYWQVGTEINDAMPLSWSAIDDGILQGLITQALENNPTVNELSWRIHEARNVVHIVSGQNEPFADFINAYDQRKRSGNAQPFVGANAEPFNLFSVGLSSRWEIDLVGRIARETQAAMADYQVTTEDLADLRRVLSADIARAYVQLRLGQELLARNRVNLEIQNESVEEVRDRITAGKVARLDLVQLNSRIRLTESDSPLFEQTVKRSFNRVALLAGATPNEEFAYLLAFAPQLQVPMFMPEVPANLIRRRPDIRRAEREVAAASARIGVAKAEFYPRLNLLGTISFDSRKLSNLLDYDSLAFSVGPGITWNILSLGRIEAQVEIQCAQLKQAVARYRQAVLAAVSEVEDALATQQQQKLRIEILGQSVKEAAEAVDLARDQYKADKASLERVVSNQRRLLRSSLLLAQARADAATAAIDLFQALGGSDGYGIVFECAAHDSGQDTNRRPRSELKWHDPFDTRGFRESMSHLARRVGSLRCR